MVFTLEHILNLIDALPKGVNFDDVKVGNNKIRLNSVNHIDKYVNADKIDTTNDQVKSANITNESLSVLVKKVVENKP